MRRWELLEKLRASELGVPDGRLEILALPVLSSARDEFRETEQAMLDSRAAWLNVAVLGSIR